MDARKIVPTVAVCERSDRANGEDCPLLHFMFTIFGIPNIERRKKKEESSHRPSTRIFVPKCKHNSVYLF